jgi:hypothetical protein
MLDSQKAIDLKLFGNTYCEFKIVSSKANSIILEFNQPSKVISKGRCAAGVEKGYIHLELDKNKNLTNSNIYLTESCLLSIETISKETKNSGFIKYVCEDFRTSESYILNIDTINASIDKIE